jgi:D-alanine-D-alanine ligase
VSLGSGHACLIALARRHAVRLFELDADALPAGLDPVRHVVFSTLHGGFGEGGGMQRLLDAAGVHYAGCGAASCALTLDKTETKRVASAAGVRVVEGLVFGAEARPDPAEIIGRLGEQLVVKPNDEGSSVGLQLVAGQAQLAAALAAITRGRWLVERRIMGRELSVGVLNGRAMGVVEIRPKSGVYDYRSKYTKGLTEYEAPANLPADETKRVQAAAETVFQVCGCRDYARVDFMWSDNDGAHLLEINPLPGMKETSLLPMSARCLGLDFTALVARMVGPALERQRLSLLHPVGANTHS